MLHGLPFVTDDGSLIEKQIEFIKDLPMKPDYIINLRVGIIYQCKKYNLKMKLNQHEDR